MLQINKIFNNSINICFAANNSYFEYLVVCIHSILKHANKKDKYDIVILENNITSDNKKILKKYESENISIRFYNMSNLIASLGFNFHINLHFSIANYFRIFIPYIFAVYSKILYLDCDAVCLSDISEIYNQKLDTNMIGAVKDFIVINQIHSGIHSEYYLNKLKLNKPLNYINSGVMLLDIPKLIQFKFIDKALNLLKEFTPLYVDQCIINKICEGHIKFLNAKYNSCTALDELIKVSGNLQLNLTDDLLSDYKNSQTNPCYVHYMSGLKPWDNPQIKNANLFWQYARETEVYEKILFNNISNKISYNIYGKINYIIKLLNSQNKILFNYYRCKLLANIMFGKAKEHYQKKKQTLKKQVQTIRDYTK